jgi:hypothetical protein
VCIAFGPTPLWVYNTEDLQPKSMLFVVLKSGNIKIFFLIQKNKGLKFDKTPYKLSKIYPSSILISLSGRVFFIESKTNKMKELMFLQSTRKTKSLKNIIVNPLSR